jgi:hypothetical protein
VAPHEEEDVMKTMIRAGAVALSLASLALLAACGDGGSDNERTPAVEPPTATASPTVSHGRTGIAGVDAAIAALESGDAQQLDALVQFSDEACVTQPLGAGGPPICAAGESAGTMVKVLPAAQCEGMYLRSNETLQALGGFVQEAVSVYGVWQAPAAYYPGGDYSIVLADDLPGMPVRSHEIIVRGGGIVGVNLGCGETPAGLVATRQLTEVVLAPAGA